MPWMKHTLCIHAGSEAPLWAPSIGSWARDPQNTAASAGGWLTCQHPSQGLFTRYFTHMLSFRHFRQRERWREHLKWPAAWERDQSKSATERKFLFIHPNYRLGSSLFTRNPRAPQPWPQSDGLGGKTAAMSPYPRQPWPAPCSSYSSTSWSQAPTPQAHSWAAWDTTWLQLPSPAGTCGGLTLYLPPSTGHRITGC